MSLVFPLVDMAPSCLVDKSGWEEFRRKIKDVSLAWNYRECINCCLYGGDAWKAVVDAGGKLEEMPIKDEKYKGEDGEKRRREILLASGVKLKNIDFFQTTVLFVNLQKMKVEDEAKLPRRQKLWSWMSKSLCHVNGSPGPFHYLIDEVKTYDVANLFKQLERVIDMPTILSQADELDAVLAINIKTSGSIFQMHTDLNIAIKRLHDMNESVGEESRITIPDSFVRARLIKGMRGVPMYKSYLDKLMCM